MSFHEVLFPLPYDYGATLGPGANSYLFTADSGFEVRTSRWKLPRASYSISCAVKDPADIGLLKAFYMCRMGRAYGFRFLDWTDNTSAANGTSPPTMLDQPLMQDGAGNYRLAKIYGGITRWILKPVAGSVLLAIGGVLTACTVDTTTGILTGFTPGAGMSVGFSYNVPVRFDSPLTLSNDDYLISSGVNMLLRELLYNVP